MYLNINTLESISNTSSFSGCITMGIHYYVGKRKTTNVLRNLVYRHISVLLIIMMTGRSVLGSIAIANYITVTTD